MELTPREKDKLLLFSAALFAPLGQQRGAEQQQFVFFSRG